MRTRVKGHVAFRVLFAKVILSRGEMLELF